MNNYTHKFEIAENDKLKTFFEKDNAEISTVQNAFWRAKTKSYSATFFKTGKLLIQGADVIYLVNKIERDLKSCSKDETALSSSSADMQTIDIIPVNHIGTDESGKGDFFGPLVIAGVLVDEKNAEKFHQLGIKDSKKLSDKKMLSLAVEIKKSAPHSIIAISNNY